MKKTDNTALGRLSPAEFLQVKKINACIIVDNVRSVLNVGSIFRTADAFRIEKIHLCGITPTPQHREMNKTALGAQNTMPWEHHPSVVDCVQELQKKKYRIITIEQTNESIDLYDFSPKKDTKYAFVFGNELFGVNEGILPLTDSAIEIPQYGVKHSLNIAVCVGIVLWDFVSKNGTPPQY